MIPVYHEIVYVRVYLIDAMNPVRIKSVLDILTDDILFSLCLICELTY